MSAEALERPLPRPTTEDYVGARLPVALVETGLALRLLKDCLIRDASSKGPIQIAKGMRK